MDKNDFWRCIDQTLNSENSYHELKHYLCERSLDEIVCFKNILLGKLFEAYTFPLLAANLVISSYVSDDGFESFRGWLISRGSNKFLNAINDPETIADWLDESDVNDVDTGEDFLCIADEAYIQVGGNDEDFYKKLTFPSEPEISMCWPENKLGYQKQYPKLVAKFWNQEQIEDLHP